MTVTGRDEVAEHIFVSYSRTDRAYVRRLGAYLRKGGIPVWWDDQLSVGERFAKLIQDRIDECFALLPVLTPAAVASEWVDLEISYARQRRLPIVPLLLERCHRPILLASLQYEDVIGGRMPPRSFVAHLRNLGAQHDNRTLAH
jgi:TIR domain